MVRELDLSSERGQELVEFALILPLLLLLLFGIIDFGIAVYRYNTIANVGREVARYGSVHPDDEDIDDYIANGMRRWTTGIVSDSTFVVTYSLPDPTVTALLSRTIRVTVTLQHQFLTGPVIQALGGSSTITMESVSTMHTEIATREN